MKQFLLGTDELRARNGGKWKMYPADVIPAFVAEMDYKIAPSVQEVIKHFTDTQDYGYGQMTDAIPLFEAFSSWMSHRHGWQPDPALTHANTSVVQGLVATLAGLHTRFTRFAAPRSIVPDPKRSATEIPVVGPTVDASTS